MQEVLSPAQELEAQQLAQAIADAAREELLLLARTLVASSPSSLFGSTEFRVRDLLLRVAAKAYQQHLEQKNGYEESSVTCPHCQQAAAYHDDRPRAVVSLVGTIRYQRAYYYCRRCGQGCAPFDQQVGVTSRHLSPAVEQLTTLAATLAVLREGDWPARRSAAWRQEGAKIQEYFENNLHRMEYPEYEAEGWQIGSGVVESACKTVEGQRLKGGKRWSEEGADTRCQVRALYRSEKGQWEAFWTRNLTKTKVYQLD